MRLLMCRPDYYGIEYAINPWMNVEKKANPLLAIEQWESLYHTILQCRARVDLVTPVAGWPDMVFTANAGLYYENKILLSHLKYKERQGESPYFKEWFEQAGFNIINNSPVDTFFFEGAGDALPAGDLLFVGYGFRSECQFYKQAPFLDQTKLVYCELTNPYYYHLDTCFCPITASLAIWYPSAFTETSQKNISANIELLAVSEEEAKQFACNAVVLGNHIILPTHCQQITSDLQKRGFIIHRQEMSEYIKAGGACKCLTLRID